MTSSLRYSIVAAVTMKFLFGKCDYMVDIDNDVSTGDFSLILGILHVYGSKVAGLPKSFDKLRVH